MLSCHTLCQEKTGWWWALLENTEKQNAWKDFVFSQSSTESCQSIKAQSHKDNLQPRIFHSPLESVSPKREILQNKRPFGSMEQKKNMRRWCWLHLREWLGRARFSTAKLNKNQHIRLYRIFGLLYFISAFSYPNMAIDARFVCVCARVKGDDVLHAQTSHCSSFRYFRYSDILLHTHKVHLFPAAMCNTMVLLHFPDNPPQNSDKSSFTLETPVVQNFSHMTLNIPYTQKSIYPSQVRRSL